MYAENKNFNNYEIQQGSGSGKVIAVKFGHTFVGSDDIKQAEVFTLFYWLTRDSFFLVTFRSVPESVLKPTMLAFDPKSFRLEVSNVPIKTFLTPSVRDRGKKTWEKLSSWKMLSLRLEFDKEELN